VPGPHASVVRIQDCPSGNPVASTAVRSNARDGRDAPLIESEYPNWKTTFRKTEAKVSADDGGKLDRFDPALEFRSFAQRISGPEGLRDPSKIDLSGKSVRRHAGIVPAAIRLQQWPASSGRTIGSSNGRCQPLSAI
jgi:hypothetical protein